MAGIHENLSRTIELEPSDDRTFGFVFSFLFFWLTFWPLVHHRPARFWLMPVALVFLLVSLSRPQLLAPLNALWTRLGSFLQKVIHPVVMGVMFYLIFVPTGVVLRWLGKDLLHLQYEPRAETYWIPRVPVGPDGASMSRQF